MADPAASGVPAPSAPGPWFVYLVECVDGSIYTGITTDVMRRYAAHCAGKGARYTRARPPLRLLAASPWPDRAAALREEYRIKQLSPAEKRAFARSKNADGASGDA